MVAGAGGRGRTGARAPGIRDGRRPAGAWTASEVLHAPSTCEAALRAASAGGRSPTTPAAGGRAALARGQREAALAGQRQPLLLPLAGRLLQPGGGHHRDAAAAARPRGAALLRHLPAVLPDVLDLVHRASSTSPTGRCSGPTTWPSCSCRWCSCTSACRSPSGACRRARGWLIPAAYLPALALAGAAVASQVLFLTTPRRRRAVADHRRHRPLEAALLRRAVRDLLRDPARLVPQDAQPDRAQADEVAGVGHRRRRAALLPVLRASRSRWAASRGWPWSWPATSRWPSFRSPSPTRW